MKIRKIIWTVFTLLVITTCCSIIVNAKTERSINDDTSLRMKAKKSEKSEKKQSYLEPIFDDFENENDIPMTYSSDAIEDAYENNYLSFSAKCKDAGIAYLEFNYNRQIHVFNFDMGIWGNDERLNTNSSITLEIKNANGNWSIYNTFNISLLSKNKEYLDSFDFSFNQNVYGTRIKVTTNSVTSTKNKGRVVLDNFCIGY